MAGGGGGGGDGGEDGGGGGGGFTVRFLPSDYTGLFSYLSNRMPCFHVSNYITIIPLFTGTVMIHCHILAHEDQGMMAVANIVDA